MSHPYVEPSSTSSSVLESKAILTQILRPAGHSKDIVVDIVVNELLYNERASIKSSASLHLLSIKKTLLYATPIIAPPQSTKGILLTSQVATPAIQYDSKSKQAIEAGMTIGDSFRLIGFAFPNKLISHLSFELFPYKYYNKLPDDIATTSISLAHLDGIKTQTIPSCSSCTNGKIYMIDPDHYEDKNLFNAINRIVAFALLNDMISILATHSKVIRSTKLAA